MNTEKKAESPPCAPNARQVHFNEPSGKAALPFPVIDLETTGLDPQRHSIISIGAVWPGVKSNDFYVECAPWKGAAIDPAALEVNGEREKELLARPVSEQQAVVAFLGWLNGPVAVAGMNPASMDCVMLKAAIARLGGWICHRSLDLHSLAVAYAFRRGLPVPPRGFATDQIYQLIGMEPEARPHHALVGALMEAEAFALLLRDEGSA
jgi:DNA polymerase III epsilon subunit-like protein